MTADLSILATFLVCIFKVSSAETCFYNDGSYDYSFDCYSGCCGNECCSGWDEVTVAGAVTGFLFGLIFLFVIIAVIARVCCYANRQQRRPVRRSPGISFVSPEGMHNSLHPICTVPVQPPSYEQAITTPQEEPPGYTSSTYKY